MNVVDTRSWTRKYWAAGLAGALIVVLSFMGWRSISHDVERLVPPNYQPLYWAGLALFFVALVMGVAVGWVFRGAFPVSDPFDDEDLDLEEECPDDEPWNDLRSAAEEWLLSRGRMGPWLMRSREYMQRDSPDEYDDARVLALLMTAHTFSVGGDLPAEEQPETYIEELRTFIQWLQARGVLA